VGEGGEIAADFLSLHYGFPMPEYTQAPPRGSETWSFWVKFVVDISGLGEVLMGCWPFLLLFIWTHPLFSCHYSKYKIYWILQFVQHS